MGGDLEHCSTGECASTTLTSSKILKMSPLQTESELKSSNIKNLHSEFYDDEIMRAIIVCLQEDNRK